MECNALPNHGPTSPPVRTIYNALGTRTRTQNHDLLRAKTIHPRRHAGAGGQTGLTGTTMSLIAKRAEASPGIIYHYFAGKDEILHTLFEQIFDEFAASVVTPEVLALPWQERYVQVWLRTFHFFAAHPHQTAYYEQYKNSAHADYDFDDVGNEHMMALIAAVQVDIAAGHVLASRRCP
ncbi:MAG: TetR/AcrR family transcriptional regulator [Caldilineaceae bacterium]